jgi:hypothetical protein
MRFLEEKFCQKISNHSEMEKFDMVDQEEFIPGDESHPWWLLKL